MLGGVSSVYSDTNGTVCVGGYNELFSCKDSLQYNNL